MISQTGANVDANVNPVYADVIQVNRFDLLDADHNPEMWKGWRNWSLQDIVKMLKDMAKPGEVHGVTAVVMGNIVLRKLLEAAADPNVPFEVIEETVHTTLETPVFCMTRSALTGFNVFEKQAVCDFFKEFVKRGIDDVRYYELIYTMLTHRLNGGFPLGFAISEQNGFNDEVLAKLPSEMQKELKSYTFDKDDKDTDRRICYSLLTGESVAM
jgi:hypothetical protein